MNGKKCLKEIIQDKESKINFNVNKTGLFLSTHKMKLLLINKSPAMMEN